MERMTSRNLPLSSRRRRRRHQLLAAASIALIGCMADAFGTSSSTRSTSNAKLSMAKTDNTLTRTSTSSAVPPGSPLSMLVDEQHEFEMNIGRALDTLRSDYPKILTKSPDFRIYDPNLEVVDPSGVKLHGLKNYKKAFHLLHGVVAIFYCPEQSGLTFRMCHDQARQNIRVHWNAQVVPKALFGGTHAILHVDGISVYELSRATGNITQHRVEHLVINDQAVRPKQGIFESIRQTAKSQPISVFNDGSIVEFRSFSPKSSQSPLFSMEASTNGDMSSSPSSDLVDMEALERKNKSRKKFGLKPLSVEEFLELEAQVQQMSQQQQQKQAAAAAELAKSKRDQANGFFRRLMGDILEDTCESNFDCERPQVCCDFGFKKMCCNSGQLVGNNALQPATVPVPIDVRDPTNF